MVVETVLAPLLLKFGLGALGLLHVIGFRAGPLRALALGLRSRLFNCPAALSQRTDDVNKIRSVLRTMERSQYLVVSGPERVGRTCAIDTALKKAWGVVEISAGSEDGKDKIVAKALAKVTHAAFSFNLGDQVDNAQRVIFFYNLIARRPPVVVVRLDMIPRGRSVPMLTCAVRALADMGLRVVVDSADYWLPDGILGTYREFSVVLRPMSKATVMADPHFRKVFEDLKKYGLDDVAWKLFRGDVAVLQRLEMICSSKDVVAEFSEYLRGEILKEIFRLYTGIADSYPEGAKLEEFLARFAKEDRVRSGEAVGVPEARNGRILRYAWVDNGIYLVPSTPIMAYILRYGWCGVPTMDILKELPELKQY